MVATKISIDDAPDFFGKVVKAAIEEGTRKGLLSAAHRMVNVIQTEVIPSISPQPSARGRYRAGWRADEDGDGAYYENTTPHAAIVEGGARPENIKVGRAMIEALVDWLHVKRIATGVEANRIAFAIAHSMASQYTSRGQTFTGGGKGIFGGVGLKIMETANRRLPQVVREEVEREVATAISKLSK